MKPQEKRLALSIWMLLILIGIALYPAKAHSQNGTGSSGPFSLQKCWELVANEALDGTVAADAGTIYVSHSSGIRAIDRQNGDSLWSTDLGGELRSSILVTPDAIYAVSVNSDNQNPESAVIRSISKQTGVIRWSSPLPVSNRFYLGSSPSGVVVVGDGGNIELHSAGRGEIVWKIPVPGPITAAYFDKGKILIGSSTKTIFVVSSMDGWVLEQISIKQLPVVIAAAPEGKIIIGDDRGELSVYNSEREREWRFKNGARILHAERVKEGVFAVSFDNFLYLLSPGSGGVVWKRRFPGRFSGQPATTSNLAVISVLGEGQVYIVELDGGRIVSQVTSDEGAVPLVINDKSIIITTSNSVKLYSVEACSQK